MTDEKYQSLKQEDDRDEPSTPQKVVMIISILVTVALFGYLTYQAVTAPATGAPAAEILQVTPLPDGSQKVTVQLTNPGGQGLRQATVEVACGSPPPSITLENIPAESHRVATVVCPPGTSASEASVTSWYEA